jgi:AraC-like DNA-binding protein
MFSAQSLQPESKLLPFIRRYVQRDSDLQEQEVIEPVVARLTTMLEFQFADQYNVPAYGIDLPNPSVPITVIGPMSTRRVRLVIRGRIDALVVLFQPLGFHRFFRIPLSPLAGTGTEGRSLLGPEVSSLYEQLGNTPAFPARALILDRFFLRCLDRFSPIPSHGRALQFLTSSAPGLEVAEAARHAGISPRQLERRSLDLTGVAPKTLIKVARFQRALKLKKRGLSWAQVANEANYYDQMHLIRDFHDLAGDSPGKVLQQITPDHLISFV